MPIAGNRFLRTVHGSDPWARSVRGVARHMSASRAACLAFRLASSARAASFRWFCSSSALLRTRSSSFSCWNSRSNCLCLTSRRALSNSPPSSATRLSFSASSAWRAESWASRAFVSPSRSASACVRAPRSRASMGATWAAPPPGGGATAGSSFRTSETTLALCCSSTRSISAMVGAGPVAARSPSGWLGAAEEPPPPATAASASARLNPEAPGRRPEPPAGGGPVGAAGTRGGCVTSGACCAGGACTFGACAGNACAGGSCAGRGTEASPPPSRARRISASSSGLHWSRSSAVSAMAWLQPKLPRSK
mmetsp:Transcript_149439/g.416496  ORF Transcript_149439/g.416496 Transcript_149439/m.416496 type:complete len:308 (-) Transcript_149439:36-959(-)